MSRYLISRHHFLSCLSLSHSVVDIVVSSSDQPNFELVYCEESIRLVSQHILTTLKWDFITSLICF
jgi:hypothetical protein